MRVIHKSNSKLTSSNTAHSHSVLRHGLRFLGLYSYLKKLISSTVYGGHPLPWRSSTLDILDFSFKKKSPAKETSKIFETKVNSVSKIDKYISSSRRIRILGISSSFILVLIFITTITPLVNRADYTEAAAGEAVSSTTTLALTSTNWASLDLTVDNMNGTFAETSVGSGQGTFTVDTNNVTGYTLTISASDNNRTLTNTVDNTTIPSITSTLTKEQFDTASYNGYWGYKPSKVNSVTNTSYLPAPTNNATTLNITKCANGNTTSTDKCPDIKDTYTIDLAARLQYTNTTGTYTNTYNLSSVGNPVPFSITYASSIGTGTISTDGSVIDAGSIPTRQYSDSITATTVTLTTSTPSRTGYTFKSWCLGTVGTDNANNPATKCTGTEFAPGADFGIDQTVAETTGNTSTLYAVWTPVNYTCTKRYGLQNADGTFPSEDNYTLDTTEQIAYNNNCTYTKSITNYKGTANGSNNSQGTTTVNNMRTNTTINLPLYRNTYTLTVSAGTNTSNATGGGSKRWGQVTNVRVTKATNTTCITYNTPTWTQSGTSGTFSSTSGASTNFTMGKGNVTITANSTASNKAQTINLSKGTGVSGITIAGTNYTGTSVSLNCGTYNISGNYDSSYEFDNWSTANNISVADTSSATTTMTVSGGGTLTLNGKSSITYMQGWTGCSVMSIGETIKLVDSRDGTEYTVGKLKKASGDSGTTGGWCWMLDNLALDITTRTVDEMKGKTNATEAELKYLKGVTTGTTSDKYATSGAIVSNANSYSVPHINKSFINSTDSYKWGNGSHKYGILYNYCAASAGTYCYGNGSSNWGSPSGNATSDICPSGWSMPAGGSNANSYNTLYTAYSSNDTNFRNALSTPLSGLFDGGSADDQGTYGYFWSSMYDSAHLMHGLYVDSSSVSPKSSGTRSSGFAVRCVEDSDGNMQDFSSADAAGMSEGDTRALKDARDGQVYTVAKIGSLVWMTRNLDLPGGTTLSSADTNVPDNYSTTTEGFTNGNTLPASSPYGFSDNTRAYVYNSSSTTCGKSPCYSYYSWRAATAGYNATSNGTSVNYDICPKGWRLPTQAEFTTLKDSYNTGAKLTASPFLGVYSGNYYNGSLYDGGSGGLYWSSTANGSYDAYYLTYGSSSAHVHSGYKDIGLSIRCVTKS